MKKFWAIALVTMIAFFLSSYTELVIGLHNFDVCNNELHISEMYNINIAEVRVDGDGWTLDKCISHAQGQILKGILLTIVSSFVLGVVISEVWDRLRGR